MPPPSRADLTPRRFSASRRFCATWSRSAASRTRIFSRSVRTAGARSGRRS